MLRIDRHPYGPRVYLLGLRIHHGSAGCALALGGLLAGLLPLLLIAAAMIATDYRDFPWRDRNNHAPRRSRRAARPA